MDAIKSFTDGVKQGVLTNNMKLIQDSLEEFMGEELAGMSVKEINKEPDDEKEVGRTTEKNPEDFAIEHPVSSEKQRIMKREPLSSGKRDNQFQDDGSIKVEDIGSELINDSAINPVKRTRSPAKKKVSIKCHICGKEEFTHKKHQKEHYRCSACCKG